MKKIIWMVLVVSILLQPMLTVLGADDSAYDGVEFSTSIVLPESLTSIGDRAFDNCTSLTSITIPSDVGRGAVGR